MPSVDQILIAASPLATILMDTIPMIMPLPPLAPFFCR
jgi:hypothetical protein